MNVKKYTQKKIKLIKPNKKGEFMKINSRDEAIGLFLNNAGLYENCDFSNLDLSYIDNDIFDEKLLLCQLCLPLLIAM